MDLKIYSPTDFPNYLPKLNSLYDDLFAGGKGFRAKLTQAVSEGLQVDTSTIHLLCQTIEFIHNSSLLHDDLVDRSSLRRGKTAAWLKYSPEYAVLAGDYLLARVMTNLSDFGNIELIRVTSQAISSLLEGEWLQDALVKNIDVSLEEIDRVHLLKTGSLFRWCLRAPFLAIENQDGQIHQELDELGRILGLLLQRSDDLLDFNIRNAEEKLVMGDLKAGYVNSFCSFLFAELSTAQRQQAAAITELGAFKEFIGEAVFAAKLKRFDEINQALIADYDATLDRLETLVPPRAEKVLETLRHLPQPLYWRDQD